MNNIKQLILTDPNYTIAALVRLYSYQSAKVPGIGFDKNDNGFLSNLAVKYYKTGTLSDPQIKAAARLLAKYSDQLTDLKPITNFIKQEPKQEEPEQKTYPAPERTAKLTGNKITIHFPRTFEDARRIKLLSGREYIKKFDYWECPLLLPSVIALDQWGFIFDSKLQTWYIQNKIELKDLISKKIEIPKYDFKKVIKENSKKEITDTKKCCQTCIYFHGYNCSLCPEKIPIEIEQKGCPNYDFFDCGYDF